MPRQNIVILLCIFAVMLFCRGRQPTSPAGRQIGRVLDLVGQEHYEPVTDDELFQGAIAGIVQSLDDPYSGYIPPVEEEGYFHELDNEIVGIGIEMSQDRETGEVTIQCPLIDSPAAQAGAQCGDIIVKVDGVSTKGLSMEETGKLIQGPAGTEVVVSVERSEEGTPIDLVITRAVVKIDTVKGERRNPDGSWNFRLEQDPEIAFVRITSFDGETARDLRRVLKKLLTDGIDGLILDLRDNRGGQLQAALDVCNLLVAGGDIVTTRGRDGIILRRYAAKKDDTLPDFPMAVLVNHDSASASEIVAGCLQDHKRAEIVGTRTYGKGTVQDLISLGEHGVLKLTTATYWRPSGENIHRRRDSKEEDQWGVAPKEAFIIELSKEEETNRFKHELILSRPLRNGDQPHEPFVDPQLQRAVEYFRSLGTPD